MRHADAVVRAPCASGEALFLQSVKCVQARGQHAEALAALEAPFGSAMTLANEREQLRAELTVRAWRTSLIKHSCISLFASNV